MSLQSLKSWERKEGELKAAISPGEEATILQNWIPPFPSAWLSSARNLCRPIRRQRNENGGGEEVGGYRSSSPIPSKA